MRPNNNQRRQRGRSGGGGGKNKPQRNQTFDSNGPEVRVRGNAHQIFEKYQVLAREAASAGDRIAAESYYQHAEHYLRLINAMGGFQRPASQWGDMDSMEEQGDGRGENRNEGRSDGRGDGRQEHRPDMRAPEGGRGGYNGGKGPYGEQGENRQSAYADQRPAIDPDGEQPDTFVAPPHDNRD